MRLVNKGGAAAPGDTDEAKKCAKEAVAPHPAHRAEAYDEQTQVSNATHRSRAPTATKQWIYRRHARRTAPNILGTPGSRE